MGIQNLSNPISVIKTNPSQSKTKWAVAFWFLISISTLIFYYNSQIDRANFPLLIGLFALLFALYLGQTSLNTKLNYKHFFAAGLIMRLGLLFTMPNFSQDFYRFIWDGQLILEGINPYIYTPDELLASEKLLNHNWGDLRNGMGTLSGSNYTSYPPINQLFFLISALFTGKSILHGVVVMRLITIAAEAGTFFFGRKILQHLKLNPSNIYWYFLNPFIIIELTGNLHFEGIMIFFIVLAIYQLFKQNWLWSAVFMAVAISVKLMPLLLLPLLLRHLKLKRAIQYYIVTGLVVAVTFLPFLNTTFLQNFKQTIGLWFVNFEFNASIYYIARWFGYQAKGYNMIAQIGPALSVVSVLLILSLSVFRKNEKHHIFLTSALFIFIGYYLFSTTVHPWYLAVPLILSIFTRFKAVIVWTAVVMFSYYAYSNVDFQESMPLIAFEYVVFIGYLAYEIFRGKGNSSSLLPGAEYKNQ